MKEDFYFGATFKVFFCDKSMEHMYTWPGWIGIIEQIENRPVIKIEQMFDEATLQQHQCAQHH